MNVTDTQASLEQLVSDYWATTPVVSDVALQATIRGWATQATADGVTVAAQVAMLTDVGVIIGHGGKTVAHGSLLCPYCKATGRGGHGGMCPRGDTGTGGQPGGAGSGGGGGGVLIAPVPLTTQLLVEVSADPGRVRQVEDRIASMASVVTVHMHGNGCCCQHCPHSGNCRD